MTVNAPSSVDSSSGPPVEGTVTILPPGDIVLGPPQRADGGGAVYGWYDVNCRWNFIQRINWPGMTPRSVVMASVSELGTIGGVIQPFIGNAHIWIKAVAPSNGYVTVRGYVDFERSLNIRIALAWWN